MPTFLEALREKLVGVLRRLREFSVRLAGRGTQTSVAYTQAGATPPPSSPQTASAGASDSGEDDEPAHPSPGSSARPSGASVAAKSTSEAGTTPDAGGAALVSHNAAGAADDPPSVPSETSQAEAEVELQAPTEPQGETEAPDEEGVAAASPTPPPACDDRAHARDGVRAEAAPAQEAGAVGEPTKTPESASTGLEPAAPSSADEATLSPPDASVPSPPLAPAGDARGGGASGGARDLPGAVVDVEEARDTEAVVTVSDDVASQSASAPVRRPVDRPRARMDPAELGRPAVVSAPPLDDHNYILWNRALANHCLLGDEVDDVLYLTITPTILAAALSEVQPGRLLPEDAEAAFVAAVSTIYRRRVIEHRQRLQTLRRCGADGLPDCIAFLAASVLAAYQMRSDEEAAATAYYSRLADLLKTDISGGHPRGFDPDEFEALWYFLGTWVRAERNRRLALPGPEAGLRRFVALPLTHVPLRRVDIERLPGFFFWAGYEPGARIARGKLDQDLASWSLGPAPFTNAGMAALRDERRPAVLAQVAHELESWDGAHTDSLGRRSGRVEILLDIVQRRPELFYLPRRPAAFPEVFDDGVHAFEASDEGWYDPVPLGSDEGNALADGFEWQLVAGRLRLVLHRPAARAIALPASHEYTGYLSHRALQLGAPAAALCCDALVDPAAEYLSEISQQRCVPLNLPGLPDGWRLFTGLKPKRRGAVPPAGLEALAVEATLDLIPTGGLRLGGRWAWVVGAAPRLMVAGLEAGERVTIDGEPVDVAEDGTVAGNGVLARPGVHVVEAAGLRRRIEITEPQIQGQPWKPPAPRTVLALPRGTWTLIGAAPGDVALPTLSSATGAVVSCSFQVVWAIEAGAGPGARVLCLVLPPPPPRVPRFPSRPIAAGGVGWASAIYNAAIRRPRMATLDGQPCQQDVPEVWAEYARAAREIKRQVRRARR